MTKTISRQINQDFNTIVEPNSIRNILEFSDRSSTAARAKSTVLIMKNARVNYVFGLFGGEKLDKNIHFQLEEGAELNFMGLFLGKDQENQRVTALIEHMGPHSLSSINVRGILQDSAFNKFRGIIRINKEAQQSSANLEQRVLLLSKNAVSEGQPELEILANDVKASHAAAVGNVNPEQIFYMTSRGIAPNTAKEMIVKGFLESMISKAEEKQITDQLEELFVKQLKANN